MRRLSGGRFPSGGEKSGKLGSDLALFVALLAARTADALGRFLIGRGFGGGGRRRFGGLGGLAIGLALDGLAARTALAPRAALALLAGPIGLLRLGRTLGGLGRAIGHDGLGILVLVGPGVDRLILARLVLGLRGKDDAQIMLGVLEIV